MYICRLQFLHCFPVSFSFLLWLMAALHPSLITLHDVCAPTSRQEDCLDKKAEGCVFLKKFVFASRNLCFLQHQDLSLSLPPAFLSLFLSPQWYSAALWTITNALIATIDGLLQQRKFIHARCSNYTFVCTCEFLYLRHWSRTCARVIGHLSLNVYILKGRTVSRSAIFIWPRRYQVNYEAKIWSQRSHERVKLMPLCTRHPNTRIFPQKAF